MGYGAGQNLYRYCQNNPMGGSDPSGLDDNTPADAGIVTDEEVRTAGFWSERDPKSQQAGLDLAGYLMRGAPGVGPVYAGIAAASAWTAPLK